MADMTELDILWVLFATVLVIAMQGGFLCLESGITRSKNSVNVALKNAVDFTFTIVLFWAVGFGLMFGQSRGGMIGSSHFMPQTGVGEVWLPAFFLFQMMFCATTATIVSGAVAERLRFNAYILITILITSVVYPVFGHWAWGGTFTGNATWLANEGFVDFAGSTVVHGTGGWVALAAVIMVGPRIGRFDREGPVPIPASDLPMAMLGLLLFFVGWVGFNGGSTLGMDAAIPGIIANTLISGAVGLVVAYLLQPMLAPALERAVAPVNGGLAGLVAITAACHAVTSLEAAAIGGTGAAVMLIADRALVAARIDDAVGAIPVHLAAGIWGTLAVAVFGDPALLDTGLTHGEQLFAQLKGIGVCALWSFGIAYLLLGLVRLVTPLRVSAAEERIGLNVSEHGARSTLYELTEVMDRQTRTFDLSIRAPVEPFTEVGQIASSYNRVVGALEEATNRTRQIVRDIRDGVLTFDAEGMLLSFNPGAEKLLEVEAGTVIGRPIDEVLADSDYRVNGPDHRSAGASAVRLGFGPCELEATGDDGTRRILEYKAFPSKRRGDGTFTAIVRDITRQRLAEEQLFMEKEHAQVTLESLGEGVITTDSEDAIRYINPVAVHILGVAEAEALGRPLEDCFDLRHESSDQPIRLGFRANPAKVGTIQRHGPIVLTRRDGSELTIKLTASPVRDRSQSIIGSVLVLQDISKSRELERELTYQASHDAVTGLLNRREFERRLAELIGDARVDGEHHVICYVDLDQFKIVNDTCGHNAGDELLRQLSALLAETLRSSDTLARLGGDEFGVLLRNCTTERGVAIANELRRKIEEFRFTWNARTFSVGASIGIAGISEHAEGANELMSMADAACYAAKDAGRNRVHVHTPDDAEVEERWGQMQWASRIQQAIDEDRLRLYSQPIVPAKGVVASPHHFEIFVRMVGNDGEMVPPGAFIPAAERYDLMTSIDRWVVRNTLAWMGSESSDRSIIAVNLSGASVNNRDFLEDIKAQIAHYRVPPERLCFEITETAAISDLVKARHFIDELKTLGCKFALDDFGSGLSSFGYLKTLPVDYLKIDGMFVRDILTDPFDNAMVESINSIGQLMGLETIAEFVENQAIMDRLAEIGIDYVQGYHIGRPEPLESFGNIRFWPR